MQKLLNRSTLTSFLQFSKSARQSIVCSRAVVQSSLCVQAAVLVASEYGLCAAVVCSSHCSVLESTFNHLLEMLQGLVSLRTDRQYGVVLILVLQLGFMLRTLLLAILEVCLYCLHHT